MEALTWILLVFFSLLLVLTVFWYIRKCSNQLDNIFKRDTRRQLLFLLLIVAFTIVYVFLLANLIVEDDQMGLLLTVYSLFSQTTGVNNAPDPIPFKLFSIFISFIGSVVFSGLLISTFNNLLQRRISEVEAGRVRYRSLNDHDVIIGGNELIYSIIRYILNNTQHRKDSHSRIVVLSAHYPNEIRNQLGFLKEQDKKRMIIYHGDMNDKEELSHLELASADRVFILGDNPVSQCDSGNILVVDDVIEMLENGALKGRKVKDIYLSFWDDSFMLKYFHDQNYSQIRLFPFNFYEMWVSKMWGYGHLNKTLYPDHTFQYHSLSQDKISLDSDHFVNVVILGFNLMGIELLKTAIKTCHYANFNESLGAPKTKITVITNDKDAIDLFQTRYAGYGHISDISCCFIEISPFCLEARQEIVNLVALPNAVSTIAICSDDQDANYTLATHLPVDIYEKKIPVVVEYHIFSAYIETMHKDKRRYSNLRFFGFRNTMVDLNYNLVLAQSVMKAEDLLFRRKNKGEKGLYTELPVLNFTSKEAGEAWHKFKIDNRRQRMLSYVDSLPSILDSMDLQLVRVKDNTTKDDYPLEQLGNVFDQIRHRQMIAWNILADYLPTDDITDTSDWEIGKVDILFPLSKLKGQTIRYAEVMEVCHFHQIALLTWLYKNGYKLESK